MKNVVCNKCGWVHFEVDSGYVLDWKKQWVKYYDSLSSKQKADSGLSGGPPSAEEYLTCFNCGGSYVNFRDYNPDVDQLQGTYTIQPILSRNEGCEILLEE